MLWNNKHEYYEFPFSLETELEEAVWEVRNKLFGKDHIYLNIKKRLGKKNQHQSIPDGYLLDFSSPNKPRLYVVEVELASHDSIRHIASQLLRINLSYEDDGLLVKKILRETIESDKEINEICQNYLRNSNFPNIDRMLEHLIFGQEFCILVIIDQIHDKLAAVLKNKFNFPIEVITLERFKNSKNECIYKFTPFLEEIQQSLKLSKQDIAVSDIDTIVASAKPWGVEEVFIKQHCWWALRISAAIIPNLKYLALYQVAPISAITHIAKIQSIKPYKDTDKYIVYFSEAPQEIKPLRLVPNGRVKASQGHRYTTYEKLRSATSMEDAF
ncbi:hypothetical protein [Rickettsiales endosymbiont of Stachyamoeba lipophora]|uniref:hypothetical protein n=1 Tax=Rickettsiales endosymbiont of Stachyamoeba lipophora TaxID=2486578 RepID=UPI000F654232|nr:hypothetical protein [Rickettsiales endosymbiont of Stachyamoeba lipophora]AZL15902.1 hypothetical protein EF513_05010 [Rickettsiales endosymbiont of Stachyamoeba lipophora]